MRISVRHFVVAAGVLIAAMSAGCSPYSTLRAGAEVGVSAPVDDDLESEGAQFGVFFGGDMNGFGGTVGGTFYEYEAENTGGSIVDLTGVDLVIGGAGRHGALFAAGGGGVRIAFGDYDMSDQEEAMWQAFPFFFCDPAIELDTTALLLAYAEVGFGNDSASVSVFARLASGEADCTLQDGSTDILIFNHEIGGLDLGLRVSVLF